MFPPPLEETAERSEDDFRRITIGALSTTVAGLAARSPG
jgi:hypothetical protein